MRTKNSLDCVDSVRIESEGVYMLTTKVGFRVKLPHASYEIHEANTFKTAKRSNR